MRSGVIGRGGAGRWLAILALFLGSTGCAVPGGSPLAQDGRLDLSEWDFERDGDVALLGRWAVCWGRLLEAGDPCPTGWASVPVRGVWSDAHVESPIGGRGVATYRLEIELPKDPGALALVVGSPLTAHRLWIDGARAGGVGEPGPTAEATRSAAGNRVYGIEGPGDRLTLQVEIANFEFRGGGIRRLWFLGRPDSIQTGIGRAMLREATLFGVGLVVGLFYLALFALGPAERARGWFGLAAIVLGLRMVPASISGFGELLAPWLSWEGIVRGEYGGMAIAFVAATGYAHHKVEGVMPPVVTRYLQLVGAALAVIIFVAPMPIVLATLPAQWLLPLVLLGTVIACYGRAWWRERTEAGVTAATALIYVGFVVHDIVRSARSDLGLTIELWPYAASLWLLAEAYQLLRRFYRTFEQVASLSEELGDANFELQETESAIVRFVPFDFLRALGKSSIRDVGAGDHARREMTVLCCRFPRAAAGTTAGSAAEQDFARAQALVARLEPFIEGHGGFLADYQGDGFEAFFPEAPGPAIEAAQEILAAFEADASGDRDPWAGGLALGLDTGEVLIGTIGSDQHLLRGIVGPSVDRARALAERARAGGYGLLVSAASREGLAAGDALRRALEPIEDAADEAVYGLA